MRGREKGRVGQGKGKFYYRDLSDLCNASNLTTRHGVYKLRPVVKVISDTVLACLLPTKKLVYAFRKVAFRSLGRIVAPFVPDLLRHWFWT